MTILNAAVLGATLLFGFPSQAQDRPYTTQPAAVRTGGAAARTAAAEARRQAELGKKQEAAAAAAAAKLRADAKVHLDKAVAYNKAGLEDAAKAALKEALAVDPTAPVPLELRGFKSRRVAGEMRAAGHLAAAGFHEEARREIEKALRANPAAPVPDHLRYLLGDPTRPLGDWLNLTAMPAAGTLAVVLIIVIAAGLLVRAGYRFFVKPPPTLHMAEFTAAGVEFDIAKTVRSITEEGLRQSRTASPRVADRITTGPIEPIEVPNAIATASPSAASIVALLSAAVKWLSRVDQLEVQGMLHAPGVFGAGLTLCLVHKKGVVASTTVWEIDYLADALPKISPQSYYGLVEPAVIWLQYELQERYGKRPRIPFNADLYESWALRRARRKRLVFDLLGATNWRSYAFFRVGARVQRRGDEAHAAKLYEKALFLDPKNRAARTNLGVLLAPSDPVPVAPPSPPPDEQRAYEEALSNRVAPALLHLERARDEVPAGKIEANGILAAYMIPALLWEAGSARAVDEADRLVRMIDEGLEEHAEPGPLRDYLLEMRAPALVMWAGVLPPARRHEGEARLATDVDMSAPLAVLQYNLACLNSLRGRHRDALRHLESSLALSSAYRGQAPIDPSLKGVREDPVTAPRFLEITAPSPGGAPAAASDALKELDIIGANSAKLVAAGITTPPELLFRTLSGLGIAALASELEMREDTVRRWAQAVQFMTIAGITASHVNVLMRAGVSSIAILARMSVEQVRDLFLDWGATEPGLPVPAPGDAALWIRSAATMQAIT